MAAEGQEDLLLLDLLDYYWFSHQIFSKTQNPKAPQTAQKKYESKLDLLQVSPKLETIFSGKEAKEMEKEENKIRDKVRVARKKKRSKSKSLSELEFEELKGFMDLGFLFSEKDKHSSSLVSIVPGLQRLGQEEEEKNGCNEIFAASRPYLSEAWDDLEKAEEKQIGTIRIPAFGNEMEIKHQLKFWAHSVASAVK